MAEKESYPTSFLKPRRVQRKPNLSGNYLRLCPGDGFVNPIGGRLQSQPKRLGGILWEKVPPAGRVRPPGVGCSASRVGGESVWPISPELAQGRNRSLNGFPPL